MARSEADEFQEMLATTKLKQLVASAPTFGGSMEDAESIAEHLMARVSRVQGNLTRGTVTLTFGLMPSSDGSGQPAAAEGEDPPAL